ncbi:TrfB-related DNA-binding protein [Dyella amyloliquefaciens]|uniref:TrfB-related DNA-binding protein n=1 Tax=Dyella amyloliquefaciens TaxID=1770545 RepID=UPI00102E5565|nr:TrfB-related DNA-binding protein [Dyella amyloliquefaciens]
MNQRFNGRRLTAAQFAVAVRGLRMTPRNQQLAREALVDGVPTPTLAARAQVTRGAIDRTIRRIYETHLARHDAPVEWREVRLTVPRSMAERFEAQAAAVIAEHDFARRLATAMEQESSQEDEAAEES